MFLSPLCLLFNIDEASLVPTTVTIHLTKDAPVRTLRFLITVLLLRH